MGDKLEDNASDADVRQTLKGTTPAPKTSSTSSGRLSRNNKRFQVLGMYHAMI